MEQMLISIFYGIQTSSSDGDGASGDGREYLFSCLMRTTHVFLRTLKYLETVSVTSIARSPKRWWSIYWYCFLPL